MTKHPPIALSLLLLLAGCPSTAAPSDLTAGAFFERYAAAYNIAYRDCVIDPLFRGSSVGLTALPDMIGSEVDASVADGHLIFDAAQAAACLDVIEGYTCTPFDALSFDAPGFRPASCTAALHGTLAASASCDNSLECASGYCDTSLACPGTCSAPSTTTPLAEGATCSGAGFPYRGACGEGLVCFSLSSSGTATCVRPTFTATAGQPCATPNGAMCANGLVCAFDGAGGGTCEARYTSGGACHSALPEGCPDGQMCDGTTCMPLPAAGQPCLLASSSVPRCAEGLLCTGGTCATRFALGDACTNGIECASGRCDGGTCVAPMLACASH